MAWNEPGNDNDNKDPWGNRRRKQDGPPDLDEMWKNFSKKLGGVLNNGGGNSGKSEGGGGFFLGLFVVLIVVYAGLGFYQVNEKEQGIVLRFGKFDRTVSAGLGWAPFFVDRVIKVNITQISQANIKGLMLTRDENIVEVQLGVQYQVIDAQQYLFNVSFPDDTVRQATESAFRQVIGDSVMDDILTTGKDVISAQTRERASEILGIYKAGLIIRAITFETARPPTEVQDAFDDAIKAREDKDRSKKLAEAYSREKEPLARGNAQKLLQEAQGYRAQVLAKANGEVARFAKLLPQYEAAPEVTRERLYIETMEEVLSNSSKVLMDVKGGNNMIYLPLDQIMKQQQLPREGN